MNKAIMILFLCVFCQQIFSEETRSTDDTTIITREMASPTENRDAMDAYNQGTLLLRQNRFEEAEKYLLRAIELDSEFVDAMDHLGLVYRNLRKYDDAERMYLMSIEINPDNIVPYINLAMVYRFQGRLEDARQIYLRAQKIDENDPEPYYGIGALYYMVGQYRISIDFINIAIQKYIEKESILVFDAYFIQGNNYYSIGEYKEALKYYRVVLSYNPNNNEIRNRISEIESRQN
jgi:tetratricopeptide (TPR) repeat protein